MLIVACVYWKGKFKGNESPYSPIWIERLQHMVEKNLSIPHRFVCLSNTEVPCERISLKQNWPGWWSKVELFRPNLFEDRVLYLDLDLLVLNDLESFVNYPSEFSIIHTSSGKRGVIPRKDGLEIKKYNSSIMVFNVGVGQDLYIDLLGVNKNMLTTLRSDQDWIGLKYPDLKTFPREWVKKLGDCERAKPEKGMKVMLCMPKKNDEAAQDYKWIKKLWV
jgi:alpha-N-acetylglucosamine transferase